MASAIKQVLPVVAGAVLALGASPARSTTIQELVRLKGHERNTLVGLGIVVGLNGTGDRSRDSLVAARPFEQLLSHLGNPIADLGELAEADAYALVQITLTVPPEGARVGDELDVSVSSIFNAESLDGGELVVSALRLPLPNAAEMPPMAFASGTVVLEGTNPRRGVVRMGAQMMADIRPNPVTASGTLTLVLHDQYAGYPVATMIASAINQEFSLEGMVDIAVVEDAKNVLVHVPEQSRLPQASFIATLLTVPIDPSLIQTAARVVINEQQGIIIVTGDVQIGGVLITHKGLAITSITPEPEPTPQNPQIRSRRWVGMDTTGVATRLADLLKAFDQLNVPVEDQIAIIHELKKTGKLHAEIVIQ
ncbi:MAG: flagellar basal body P-ring protein FlgI [Planctomycetota bacterium]